MKNYSIKLTDHEMYVIQRIIVDDLNELVLDKNIVFGYRAILNGTVGNGFIFKIDDSTAMEIIQTMLVYADRFSLAENYSYRAMALIQFSTQMLTSFTGKTESDY